MIGGRNNDDLVIEADWTYEFSNSMLTKDDKIGKDQ
jgi:hypothetical protein